MTILDIKDNFITNLNASVDIRKMGIMLHRLQHPAPIELMSYLFSDLLQFRTYAIAVYFCIIGGLVKTIILGRALRLGYILGGSSAAARGLALRPFKSI